MPYPKPVHTCPPQTLTESSLSKHSTQRERGEGEQIKQHKGYKNNIRKYETKREVRMNEVSPSTVRERQKSETGRTGRL